MRFKIQNENAHLLLKLSPLLFQLANEHFLSGVELDLIVFFNLDSECLLGLQILTLGQELFLVLFSISSLLNKLNPQDDELFKQIFHGFCGCLLLHSEKK